MLIRGKRNLLEISHNKRGDASGDLLCNRLEPDFFGYKMDFFLSKQSQNLDPSYKTDLDFFNCFKKRNLSHSRFIYFLGNNVLFEIAYEGKRIKPGFPEGWDFSVCIGDRCFFFLFFLTYDIYESHSVFFPGSEKVMSLLKLRIQTSHVSCLSPFLSTAKNRTNSVP